MNKSKCLASLAVFRELYDSKKDVYEIIGEFLREIIISNGKNRFDLTEITLLLNDTFDFIIPEAVVKTALKRLKFLKRKNSLYLVHNRTHLRSKTNISEKHLEIKKNNDDIIDKLFEYVENEHSISKNNRHKIIHAFCNFLLDESIVEEYSEYISAFIVKNKADTQFTKQLDTIKEGVVLYSGIKYTSNINNFGNWKTTLTIFLDMEILFHFAGFNGEIYKQSFGDFHSFVKQINHTSRKSLGKDLIYLKFFKEIKIKIDAFFEKAINIFEKHGLQDPQNTAMNSILDGCKSTSDIITKKSNFFHLLQNNSILEDNYDDYFTTSNHNYNIEDKQIIDDLSETIEKDDIKYNLTYLNYINILRKNNSKKHFDNIGYILLTGNSTSLTIAWNKYIKENGSIPLSTNLDYLTNKFWFRLSRGFGSDCYPKTFGVITKAQIVLSSRLYKSVGKKFDELQIELKSGKLTEEQALSVIYELRIRTKKPEEIDSDDLLIIEEMNNSDLQQYSKEHELLKTNFSKQKYENEKLKEDLKLNEKKLDQYREEINSYKKIVHELKDVVETFSQRDNEKRKKIQRIKNFLFNFIITLVLFIITYAVVTFLGNIFLGAIIGVISSVITLLMFFGIDYRSIKILYNKNNG